MIDLEIYTDKIAESGRRLIRKAYEEAKGRDHNQLAPEHLFISIAEIERLSRAEAARVHHGADSVGAHEYVAGEGRRSPSRTWMPSRPVWS